MRAITLHQPWATLVAIGEKRIETRAHHWYIENEEIAIHAGKTPPDLALCRTEPFRSVLIAAGYTNLNRLPLGAILSVHRVKDVWRFAQWERHRVIERALGTQHDPSFGNFETGRWGYLLTDRRQLPEPIPCRGMQGLWPVPPDVARSVAAAALEIAPELSTCLSTSAHAAGRPR